MTFPTSFLVVALSAAFLLLQPSSAAAQPCASGDDIVVTSNFTTGGVPIRDDNEVGQSFTTPCDGVLKSVTVSVREGNFMGPLTGTFRVYSGAGTSGAVLVEQSFNYDVAGDKTLAFADVAVASGQPYTFFFDQASGSANMGINNSNAYLGGALYFGAEPETAGPSTSTDLAFTADLEPAPTTGTGVEIKYLGSTDEPQRGDFVFVRALATNNEASAVRTRVYVTVGYPDGTMRTYSVLSKDFPGNTSFKVQDIKRIKVPVPANAPAGTYTVTLYAANDIANGGEVYDTDSFTFTLGPINNAKLGATPEAGPNPFTTETTIRYELAADADVDLRVFDATGREVATLASGVQSEGVQSAVFAASDLPGGVYVWRLAVGGEVTTGRVTLAR